MQHDQNTKAGQSNKQVSTELSEVSNLQDPIMQPEKSDTRPPQKNNQPVPKIAMLVSSGLIGGVIGAAASDYLSAHWLIGGFLGSAAGCVTSSLKKFN